MCGSMAFAKGLMSRMPCEWNLGSLKIVKSKKLIDSEESSEE